MNTLTLDHPETIYNAVLRLKKLNNLRQRDIAEQLSISECEVLASRCGLAQDELGQVMRLNCDSNSRIALFNGMPSVGQVMVLTRNESVVHERKGRFETVQVGDKMGLVLGADIDLRLFLSHWQYAYAVTDIGDRTLHSIQFFDAYGTAIQKIYATSDTDLTAFQTLMHSQRAVHQDSGETVLDEPQAEKLSDISQINRTQFQADWLAITDVHQFFGLLKSYGLSRTQAYSIAPDGYAQRVAPTIMSQALELSAVQALPLMIFVGNRGAIQIHTGEVKNLKRMGDWYNVLDPDFNLHVKENQIASAWVVRRPSADGVITSIDFFDAEQQQIMTFFGKRVQNEPELAAWTQLIEQLVGIHDVQEA